ncbi:MAG TPA: hypothetical protein VF796_20875 [Humisphaera sp.]
MPRLPLLAVVSLSLACALAGCERAAPPDKTKRTERWANGHVVWAEREDLPRQVYEVSGPMVVEFDDHFTVVRMEKEEPVVFPSARLIQAKPRALNTH